jgi:curved DNA-binding protein CbpA
VSDDVRARPADGGLPGPGEPAVATLASWLDAGRRGVVEVRTAAGACRLLLAGGTLRLDPADPLAAAGSEESLEPLIERLAGAPSASLRFTPRDLPATEQAPLPAARLLMEAAARGRDRAQLWALLGGRAVALAMAKRGGLAEQALADLDPRRQALLRRFVKSRRAVELVTDDEAGFETLRDLARLSVVGLLAAAELDERGAPAALSDRSKELFLRRIERELERRPLTLNPEEHRGRVVELLRNLGTWNHYELLRVGRHADEHAIHQAYVEIAGIVHPSHAAALGFERRAAALEPLFEAATEAYLVLSHPDRRRAYDRDLGPEVAGPASDDRRREKASVARDMYRRARRMALADEYQPVLELMQQAILLDPQAEYYRLLGDVQRRNPQWKSGAVASYRDAVRCRPNDADLRLAFAQVLEELGDRKQAGIQYRAALELRPGDETLQAALDAFEHPKRAKKAKAAKGRDQDDAAAAGGDAKKSAGGKAKGKATDGDDGGLFPTFKKLFRRGGSGSAPAKPADDDDDEFILGPTR